MKRVFVLLLGSFFIFVGSANAQITLDGSGNVGIGTAYPEKALHLDGGSLLQTPVNPLLVGGLDIGGYPQNIVVSGAYAYVADYDNNQLKVIDVSDPAVPAIVGSIGVGDDPRWIDVSGRYAYVVHSGSDDLKVIDISNPSAPSIVGSKGIGTNPRHIVVSGRYAYIDSGGWLYVVDISNPGDPSTVGSLALGSLTTTSMFMSVRYLFVIEVSSAKLMLIDVSDPSSPGLAGSLSVGIKPKSLYVSGRYAYVIDFETDDLKVIDVSDPGLPAQVGSLSIGFSPQSVFVSGRYAYVTDSGSDDLKVIDVSDPSMPILAGSLYLGGLTNTVPSSVFVSGRYAYVVDFGLDDLKVIDVSGAEVTALMGHSLEAGNLQVRNDVSVQGQLRVASGVNVGPGGLFSDGNIGLSGTLAIANDIAPSSSPAGLVQLYAEDAAGSSELKVRDESGTVTTLSPHNFSLIGQPSEPMAWSFFSENRYGKINVDMLRVVRLMESVTGEKLVHIEGDAVPESAKVPSLKQRVAALEAANRNLRTENAWLRDEIRQIKLALYMK